MLDHTRQTPHHLVHVSESASVALISFQHRAWSRKQNRSLSVLALSLISECLVFSVFRPLRRSKASVPVFTEQKRSLVVAVHLGRSRLLLSCLTKFASVLRARDTRGGVCLSSSKASQSVSAALCAWSVGWWAVWVRLRGKIVFGATVPVRVPAWEYRRSGKNREERRCEAARAARLYHSLGLYIKEIARSRFLRVLRVSSVRCELQMERMFPIGHPTTYAVAERAMPILTCWSRREIPMAMSYIDW